MRHFSLFVCVTTWALLASGCKTLKKGAIEEHAKTYSCPEAQIQARERTDLDAYTLTFGASAEPSAEIKSDPARYAVWKQNEAEKRAQWNSGGDLLEATGCGHSVVYYCFHPATYQSKGAANYAYATCNRVPHQPNPAE